MFVIILAIDQNNLIGDTKSKNGLPWHYPEDLKFYQNKTKNKKTVMGRKTFECIGKPLKDRETYILTRKYDYQVKGATVLHTIDDIIKLQTDNQEILIVGGVDLFEQMNDFISKIYLTRISASHSGDIYYHHLDLSNFNLTEQKKGQTKELCFQVWEKEPKQKHKK